MNEKQIVFDSVVFDKEDKTFTILDGTIGTYSLEEVVKCTILGEKASRKGRKKPFTHYVLIDPGFKNIFEPAIYIGLKVDMKNGDAIAIYVSKEKTYVNTTLFLKDMDEANRIKKIIDK